MTKIKDLTNNRFGKLIALCVDRENRKSGTYWICECDCGIVKSVRGCQLSNQTVTSCGCHRIKDLTGTKIKNWTVLHIDKDKREKGKPLYWICMCGCGNQKSISGSALKYGRVSESCGCIKSDHPNVIPMENKKYGRLTVIGRDYSKMGNNAHWICRCDCGKVTSPSGTDLRNGDCKSCGCYAKEALVKSVTKHGMWAKVQSGEIPQYEYVKFMSEQCPQRKLRRYVSSRIADHIRGRKSFSIFKALPYSFQDLCNHLESLWDKGMTWQNYGKYWHIDHIIPHSYFKYECLTDKIFLKCWSLDNLRPLTKEDNKRKGSRILPEFEHLIN